MWARLWLKTHFFFMQIFVGLFTLFFLCISRIDRKKILDTSRYRQYDAFSRSNQSFCQTPNTIVRDHIPNSMMQNYEQMNKEKDEMADCAWKKKVKEKMSTHKNPFSNVEILSNAGHREEKWIFRIRMNGIESYTFNFKLAKLNVKEFVRTSMHARHVTDKNCRKPNRRILWLLWLRLHESIRCVNV